MSRRCLVALALAARAAAADPPAALLDGLRHLHADLLDFDPADQAAWEASRYRRHALRAAAGNAAPRERAWALSGHANLEPTGWLLFRLDARDERTPDAELSRLGADMLFRVAPGLEVGVSGSPDVLKDRGAWGLAALHRSKDGARFLAVRVLQERPLYDQKNFEGGRRDGEQWRGQLEARWAAGDGSIWLRLDGGNAARFSFPAGDASSEQRSEADLHLRWGAVGVRVAGRRQDGERASALGRDGMRRGSVVARPYASLRFAALTLRATGLWAEERAVGFDAGRRFEVSRRDLGARLGALFERGPASLEIGHGIAVSGGRLAEEAHLAARFRFGDRAHLRLLGSRQLASGAFGGLGGSFEAVF